MKCLFCGKDIRVSDEICGWHKRCIKQFFGISNMPQIDIDDQRLNEIAHENINKGQTIPGVQKKLSLHLSSDSDNKNPRLTLVNYPTGYIFKPQVDEFVALPEAEHLVMSMADAAKIATVPHGLLKTPRGYGYITRRIDRIIDNNSVKILAMEDFCQLDLRLTQDKYKGSYERCAKVIEKFSYNKGLDMAELYLRIVFSFIVGNSDMHLKNFSLIETVIGSENYSLSPAYDLVPVNIIMPEDKEQFALPINGKKTNIQKKDFLIFAEFCNISKISAEKMIKKLVSMEDKFGDLCASSLLPDELKENFKELIKERILILK